MKSKVSLLAGAAILAFASGPAVAQSAPSLPESNFKCWDAAKNQVRDRLAGVPNIPSTNIASTPPSTTGGAPTTGSGSLPSRSMSTSPGVTNPGVPSGLGGGSRPAEAAGLPIC